ncbi:ABC transporter permease [Flavobacterium branchiophilum]|uniref:ABC transporter permease n=1 Tax=Flavobacterium branchiophilum TaxID=55197 RepID=A0A2H3KIP9_9FLAO|nr:FtsX-like permease family protein [Flavobacterium branchiophilum]PDS24487.1 ABC transporter permease [Flavobacterium branchiophilum]
MNICLYIAKRYVFSKSKNNAINIITRIATIGIVVGAGALFVFLSVFSGLKDFSLSFSNKFDPDLKVFPTKGKMINVSNHQKQQLMRIEGIAFKSFVLEERVLFVFEGKEAVATIKGVDEQYANVNLVEETLFNGQWLKPITNQVVVGHAITEKLSLGLFDYNHQLKVFVPKPGHGAIENPQEAFSSIPLTPIGIYAVNEDIDNKYVFADLGLVQELMQYQSHQISHIEIQLKPDVSENDVITQLKSVFNNQIIVKNRMQLNDSLYKMLQTENTVLYLIFTLVIVMTLFTLAGAIIMMIIDKKAHLKTLYNLGLQVDDIRKIFLLQGIIITFIGGVLGLFLGVMIVLLQEYFQLVMITSTLPYPVIFEFQNVLLVLATIFVLGFLASLIASNRVSEKLLIFKK